MYSDYSIIDVKEICEQKSISVLHKLPEINGPQLVTSLIKPLVSSINKETVSYLHNDKDVQWIMEVIGFGLSLPLSDNELNAVRDCVNIYCDWFHVLSPKLSANKFIPYPIRQDPNVYCQKIIGHLYNIFLQRTFANNENINDLISRQAVFCHRILRLVIAIASEKDNLINSTTWECILTFLLGINEALLKSQIESNDIGSQIAERVISTLFQGWLVACVYYFPSPSYWKTFQNICINLRHRPALVIQWNRINICLTKRLVEMMYKTKNTLSQNNENNLKLYNDIIVLLNEDALKQCWFRFIHIIGNPIELCFPEIIFKMETFNQNIDHSSINLLPFIFHKAIKGLCTLVDIFLGIPNINLDDLEYELPKFQSYTIQNTTNITPPEKKKSNFSLLNKSEKQTSITRSHASRTSRASLDSHSFVLPNIILPNLPSSFYQNHIKSTSILDIFGKWLFQASLISSPNNSIQNVFETALSNNETHQIYSFKRSLSRNSSSDRFDEHLYIPLDSFEAGQAEAIGTLSRIFCFKKCDEDIAFVSSKQNHPDFLKIKNYLTSYYLALKFGLSSTNENIKNQLLSSILVNSVGLFEVDLPGSKILIPHFLRSIETFLYKKDKSSQDITIRRSCIKILISLLSYPLHYKHIPIKDDLSELPCKTFFSLCPRLIQLLICGLYNEPDPKNVQLILGALLFFIEDSVHYEDLFTNENLKEGSVDDLTTNLLMFLKVDYQKSNEKTEDMDKLDNLFLLIISFVAEILCKTSFQNSNYNVSLTALEVLSALGRVHNSNQQLLCDNKCKHCIKQICTFIENQCYKQAMFHSKDMHSTIVAAYQCLSIWINEHFHLLKDKECIVLLFELIELGISGSKSKKENVLHKSDKNLKPTSMRVREAAEFLLTTLMSRIDFNFSPLYESILSCDINESKIIEHILNLKPTEYPSNHFRYFIAENSLLISILDRPLQNEETICIIRSPYGKYCWLMKYQHMSNRHTLNFQNDVSIYRSLNKSEQNPKSQNVAYFPEFYDKICQSKYDNMVLKLPNYINDLNDLKQDNEIMKGLIDKIENHLNFEKTKLTLNTTRKDFGEPLPSKTFEAYRLILSQFKVFNLDIQNNPSDENHQNIVVLNNNSKEFIEYLNKLDTISTKNNDLVMVFYIPKGFTKENEIMQANMQHCKSNQQFSEFLSSLGYPIEGQTSSLNSSKFFYWSDISHELIFICPTMDYGKSNLSMKTFIKEDNDVIRNKLLRTNESENSANDNIKSYLLNNAGCDIKVFVLWLESMEDFDKLPFGPELANNSEPNTDYDKFCVIVINPLKNGLFKVIPHSFGGRSNTPSLIIDRMILNKHLLAPYVRITALNLFRRRKMNIESFQPPHVKRRSKIQEISNKFKQPYSNTEMMCDLFRTKFL